MPSADKITTTCLLFVASFAERLYWGDISNWKLPAGKEKRKTTLDHWRVKIMTTVIWQLFKRVFWLFVENFPPTWQHGTANGGSWQQEDVSTVRCRSWTAWGLLTFKGAIFRSRRWASSVGFKGCSDYVHSFGLAAVLPVFSAPVRLGRFCFFPRLYHWVSLGEPELQWMRGRRRRSGFIKTQAAVIRPCGPALLAAPWVGEGGAQHSCGIDTLCGCVLVIGRQGKKWTWKKQTNILVMFLQKNSYSESENTEITSFYFEKQPSICRPHLFASRCTWPSPQQK